LSEHRSAAEERSSNRQRDDAGIGAAADGGGPEAATWKDFCRRLEALGEEVDDPEGLSHLVEQVVCWLGWSVLHADARLPAFHRQNDLVTRWGGPNADNVYRHARIDANRRYRIVGRMHGCDDFILAIRAGFMHMERWGTLAQVTASEVGIGPGDDFELFLGGPAPGAIALPEGTAMVSIREYYFDWLPREPAVIAIECLDDEGSGRPLTGTALASLLDDAAAHVEQSMGYWNRYLVDARAAQIDNSFAPSIQVAKGLESARYAYCFWNLAPGEALYVESDVPAARYWGLQLYNLRWFEAFELNDRVTTLNHRQMRIGDDDRVRAVVSHVDPTVPNWLDTGGRREGLLMLRWFWPTGDAPSPSARVVDVQSVRDEFPADFPVIDADGRGAERRARLEHLAWRFRT
jgi:hypothetical protein